MRKTKPISPERLGMGAGGPPCRRAIVQNEANFAAGGGEQESAKTVEK
jgi:hypothetical protein